MAAALRLLAALICLLLAHSALALPLTIPPALVRNLALPHALLPRSNPIINNSTGTVIVADPSTGQIIPQGPATDGSGAGFSPPAIIWLGFCVALGIPLAAAGVRGWRLTTGTAIGLSTAVCAWAAFINTVNQNGVSDMLLTLIVMAFFALGFVFGLFEIGRLAGIGLLGIVGGLAFGLRIPLLKDGLLIQSYILDWVVVGACGVGGGIIVITAQRAAIVLGSASAGTFLSALAVDLFLNKQDGMSRGLRFMFDRNSNHLADIVSHDYHPKLVTQIILGASLALTPILAYAQHRIFRAPFDRTPPPPDPIFFDTNPDNASLVGKTPSSRFSL